MDKFFPKILKLCEFDYWVPNKTVKKIENFPNLSTLDSNPLYFLKRSEFKINGKLFKVIKSSDLFIYKGYISNTGNGFIEIPVHNITSYLTFFVTRNCVIDNDFNLLCGFCYDKETNAIQIFVHYKVFSIGCNASSNNRSSEYEISCKNLMKELFSTIEHNMDVKTYINVFNSDIKMFEPVRVKPVYNVRNYMNNLIKNL